jgi:hypothetical protein
LYVREAKLLYATTTKRTETQHFLLFFFFFFLIQILQFSSEVPYSALETPSFETSIADKNEACTQRERERERTADLLRVRRRLTQLMKEISGLDYTVRGFMGGQGLKRRATFSLLLHSGCC